jgi:hypothetical protein
MPESMLPACNLSKNAATEAAEAAPARSMGAVRSTEAAEVTGVAADPPAPEDPMVCREIPEGCKAKRRTVNFIAPLRPSTVECVLLFPEFLSA